ncbi:MAG: hypothetical protein ACFFA7_10740 [Promethearchaeota archaeon]
MEKINFRILACIVIINLTVASLFFLSNGKCATQEIDSKYGETPVIDGYIDISTHEWRDAYKGGISLDDLNISLWVMQDEINLYISVQFDLESGYHSTNEFVGLIISNSSSEDNTEFIDAKIIQFTNISANEYSYFDYNVSHSESGHTDFTIDTEQNGKGAATLEDLTSIYEFSLPIKGDKSNKDDAALDFGNAYAFNITYGDTSAFPNGIKKSAIVLINIKSVSTTTFPIFFATIYVFTTLLFSIMGIFLGIFIYRIFKLKEKIKRYKR